MAESRTKKSIRNSSVALMMYFINLVLQFYSRKIFLDYLGTEILGLNTTASNLLQFLNLAELGIGSAVAFNLYKPLADGDYTKISEIVSYQGHVYKRIALGIILASIVLMCFFPLIFKKIELPLWYAYASFSVLLFSSLLSYFVNYKQVVLTANQQDYKINYSYKSIMLLKVLCQIFAVRYLKDGYFFWLILEVLFAIFGSISLHIMTIKNFPCLSKYKYSYRDLRLKYKHIEIKIKQLFFHKAAGFALNQTSPLILYGFASLTAVTYYQNYMLIFMGLVSLMSAVFNGITASIGNVSAQNPDKLFEVFKELFSVRFYISSVISYAFYTLTTLIVSAWIGSQYILESSTLKLLTVLLFITLTRQTVENYLYSLGMFQDIWSPICEMIINIGLSIWFGYYWGLNGIVTGVLISLIVIVMIWKPYFLFKYGLKVSIFKYINLYIKHLLVLLCATIINLLLIKIEFIDNNNIWLISFFSFCSFAVSLIIVMLIVRCDINQFFLRIYRLFIK